MTSRKRRVLSSIVATATLAMGGVAFAQQPAAPAYPPPGYAAPPAPPPGYPPPQQAQAPGYPPAAPQAPPPGYPPPAAPQAPPPGYPAPGPAYPPAGYQEQQYGNPQLGQVVQQAGAQKHDGFYLRLMLGPGYTSTKVDAMGTPEFKGVSTGFDVAAGYSVAENLAVYGQIVGTNTSDPETNTVFKGKLGTSGFGVGASYFVMPLNLYFHGGLLATTVSFEPDGATEKSETETGFGLNVGIGKEWWLSDNWGLGAGAQLLYSQAPDQDDDTWTTIGFTVGVSAHFN